MIIDNTTLAGKTAYLRNANGKINILDTNSNTTRHEGRSFLIAEGMAVEVNSLCILIERKDIIELFHRNENPTELLSIRVIKEMFPGLFKDPYENRVHNISGFEDFTRGMNMGFRIMEVSGIPTLVSTVENCQWRSEVYKMPQKPVRFNSAAWDLPSSKHTPVAGFSYDLNMYVWKDGQDLSTQPERVVLASGANPRDPRFKELLDLDIGIDAYQIEFKAKVNYDAFLKERHIGYPSESSMGRPLLRSINLLERVTSSHVYYSIQEIIQNSYEYKLFEHNGGEAPKLFTTMLNCSAMLTKGESISIVVHREPNDQKLKHVEARMNAKIYVRPPRIDKEV